MPSRTRSVAAAIATALVVTALATPPAHAATVTIAVAPNGDDANPGTPAQPVATPAKAQQLARAQSAANDVVVQLAGGTYRLAAPLRFTSADSGQNGHTVTWQAAAGQTPVLSGGSQVGGWSVQDAGQNIWVASVPQGADSRQLFVDGALAPRAAITISRNDVQFTTTGMNITNSALNYLATLPQQNRIEVESQNSFTDRYSPVDHISGTTITMQQPAWNNNNWGYDTLAKPFGGGQLFLENSYSFLKNTGQWYLDPQAGKLYYKAPGGWVPGSHDVELPRLTSLLQLAGTYDNPVRGIAFKGLNFEHTTWLTPSTSVGYANQQTGTFLPAAAPMPGDFLTSCQSGCKQFEGARNGWAQAPAAVQVSAATGITFSGNTFTQLGQVALGIGNDANAHAAGIGLGASSITVDHNTFTENSGGGIIAGGVRPDAHHPSNAAMTNRDITLSYNTVSRVALDYREMAGILSTYATHTVITHNDVSNLTYDGIDVGWGWGANDQGGAQDYRNRGLYDYQPVYTTPTTLRDTVVSYNRVHGTKKLMHDGGSIYNLSANPGSSIDHNYVYDNNRTVGLYLDEGSRYVTVSAQRDPGLRGLGVHQRQRVQQHQRQHLQRQLAQRRRDPGGHRAAAQQRPDRERPGQRDELAVGRPAGHRRRGYRRHHRPGRGPGAGGGREQVPGRQRRLHHTRRRGPGLGLQRRHQPVLDPDQRRRTERLQRRQHPVPRRLRPGHQPRHQGRHLELQRPEQPAVAGQHERHHQRGPVRAVPRRHRLRHRERHLRPAGHLHRREQPEVDPRLSTNPLRRGFVMISSLRRKLLTAAAALLLTAGAVAGTVTTAQAATQQACDIYAAGGTPCVTAHSTTRALFAAYNGPLYQIQRASDQKYLDIGLLAAGGYADSAPQVSFCAGTRCTVTKIYDQTANHNDLPISWGGFWKGPGPNGVRRRRGRDGTAGDGRRAPGVRDQGHPGRRLPDRQRQGRAGRVAAGGHLHGHLVELRQPVVLLRLRQRRDLPHRHRQRHHERDRVGHRLLVRRLHRHRPVGRSRPGERHVPHRDRLQQGPEQPRRALPVRQCVAEEQRHQQLHAEIRQRHHRRPDHAVLGRAAARLLADEAGAVDPAGHRAATTASSGVGEFFEGRRDERLPVGRHRERGAGQHRRGRLRTGGGSATRTGAVHAVGAGRCLDVPNLECDSGYAGADL